jgi:hypothetical protein
MNQETVSCTLTKVVMVGGGTAHSREVRDKGGTKGEDGLPLAAADQNTVSVFSRLTAIIPSFHLHHYITPHQPEHYRIPY